jgi:hypothetical protein
MVQYQTNQNHHPLLPESSAYYLEQLVGQKRAGKNSDLDLMMMIMITT